MKKSIVSLIAVVALFANMICPFAFADAAPANALSLADVIAKDVYGGNTNVGEDILENDKYVFVVEGAPVGGFENDDIHLNSKIHIYEKPNNEHINYKYLTSILRDSSNASRDLPARSVALYDDVLYVAWGNAAYSKDTHAFYPADAYLSYAMAYDVSEIEAGVEPTGLMIATSLEQRTTPFVPFIRGGILTLDEENGKIYISGVSRTSYGRREYYEFDPINVKAALDAGSASALARETVLAPSKSRNTVKFEVKDGYLYEVLQQKGGLIDFTGDNTLVDADGNAVNNTIEIYDANAFTEIGEPSSSTATYMTGYKKGEYTTATSGGVVINDIAVSGDYMYIATVAGLEVVDVSSAKAATEAVTLTLTQMLNENTEINAVTASGNKLYVGTNEGMLIYDISDGIPVLLESFTHEGGFAEFKINTEENTLYALSAAAKGGVVIIDLDSLMGGLYVTDFEFLCNSEVAEEISEGTLSYSGVITNNTAEALEFKAVFALYKDNKLIDVSIEDYALSAGESVTAEDSLEVPAEENLSAKVMLINAGSETDLLPMITETETVFEKEIGVISLAESVSADSVNISELDSNGNITVSGTIAELKNKPLLITAENLSADFEDRLAGYRYIDVVTVDADGKYSAQITPSDSGDYEIKISKAIGTGASSGLVEVPQTTVTLQNTVEVPGIESFLYIEFENGQNINTIELEVTFDDSVLTAGSDITPSNEFVVSDVSTENGNLTAKFTKKDGAVLKTEANEFCIIPVTVASDAALGNYDITVSADIKDELSHEINAAFTSGVLSLVESTPKYEALDAAKAALKALKKADEITVDDYLEEKVKIENARAKVNTAYEYFIRDSQLGTDLVKNLLAAEDKMVEIAPYYEAVDDVNSADAAEVVGVIKENKDYFSASNDAFTVYEGLTDKSSIDSLMADIDFTKPFEVYKTFGEALVLEAFGETNWQNVGTLLALAEDAAGLNLSDYKELTSKQKAVADKALALTEYESMQEIKSALLEAVAEAKKPTGTSQSGSGSSRGSGSGKDYYVQPDVKAPETEKEPVTETEIFSDISEYGWAKEAIGALYENGIINGKASGIFAPNDTVTREEFAKMVSLAFDIDAVSTDVSFTDVDENAWYGPYVYALASSGIINGQSDGTYGVGENITREDMAVILERVASFKGIQINAEIAADFADSVEISGYAVAAINKMYSGGIISGYPDGSVRPKESANRAAAAQLIYKMMILGK